MVYQTFSPFIYYCHLRVWNSFSISYSFILPRMMCLQCIILLIKPSGLISLHLSPFSATLPSFNSCPEPGTVYFHIIRYLYFHRVVYALLLNFFSLLPMMPVVSCCAINFAAKLPFKALSPGALHWISATLLPFNHRISRLLMHSDWAIGLAVPLQ